ncbi:MAG: hypothetical protein QM758_13690 [Armatimonas sp.]
MDIVCRCVNTLPEAEPVVQLFEGIANLEGWQPGDQLRAHTERSIYFGAFDANRLVGGLQLVASDQAGRFSSHEVWPEIPLADKAMPTLHAAVLAVIPEFRGRDGAAAFWSLGIVLWRHCVENGVKAVYLEATPKMLRCYRLLGWPLEVIGELREHWGEPCYPCQLSVRDVAGSLAERSLRSTTYRGIFTAAIQPVVIATTPA